MIHTAVKISSIGENVYPGSDVRRDHVNQSSVTRRHRHCTTAQSQQSSKLFATKFVFILFLHRVFMGQLAYRPETMELISVSSERADQTNRPPNASNEKS